MADILFVSSRNLDKAPFEREDKKKRLILLLKKIRENQLKEFETNPDKIEKPWLGKRVKRESTSTGSTDLLKDEKMLQFLFLM